MGTWSVDLPYWQPYMDPELPDEVVWVHHDYHGVPDLAIVRDWYYPDVASVLAPVMVTPVEIDGCNIATFIGGRNETAQDAALDYALAYLEQN